MIAKAEQVNRRRRVIRKDNRLFAFIMSMPTLWLKCGSEL